MSTPVTPEDKAGYRLTPLLAEVLTDRSYDGVQYRSSVSHGVNICLFDPAKAFHGPIFRSPVDRGGSLRCAGVALSRRARRRRL